MNFIEIHGAEYMLFYEKSNQKDKIVSILKEADEVIALSAEWKKKFDETFGLKNCVVLENGIDTERLKPAITSVKDHPWKNPKSVFYIYLRQIYRDSLKTYNNRAMRLLREECRHEFWASYEPASDNSGGKPENHGDYYLEEEVKTMRGKGIASRKKSSI